MPFQNTYRRQYLTVNIAHATCGKVVGPFGQQLSPELLQLQRSKNMDMKGWQMTECKVHTTKKGTARKTYAVHDACIFAAANDLAHHHDSTSSLDQRKITRNKIGKHWLQWYCNMVSKSKRMGISVHPGDLVCKRVYTERCIDIQTYIYAHNTRDWAEG